MLKDGWLRTGDIGYMDARGWFAITDCKKDMILVSGFNVYPSEVESVVVTMPGILECGVVGVPDAKSGEAVKAVIVRSDSAITQDAVIAHCRAHLAPQRGVPRSVAAVADRQDPAARAARPGACGLGRRALIAR